MLMIWSSLARNRSPSSVVFGFFGSHRPLRCDTESCPAIRGNLEHEIASFRGSGPQKLAIAKGRCPAKSNPAQALNGSSRATSYFQTTWLYKQAPIGWGPSARYQRFPTHGTFRNGAPLRGMIPNCGLSSLVLTAYGGSRGAAVYPRVRRSQSRPKPNGHAPDPRVMHGQHPFSYRWTAASSSFSSATVRSIMPCAKSSIGNPSTRR